MQIGMSRVGKPLGGPLCGLPQQRQPRRAGEWPTESSHAGWDGMVGAHQCCGLPRGSLEWLPEKRDLGLVGGAIKCGRKTSHPDGFTVFRRAVFQNLLPCLEEPAPLEPQPSSAQCSWWVPVADSPIVPADLPLVPVQHI